MRRNRAAFDGSSCDRHFGEVAEPVGPATILGRRRATDRARTDGLHPALAPLRRVRGRRGSAQAHGLPYTLSTYATTSIPDMAAAAPEGRNWSSST